MIVRPLAREDAESLFGIEKELFSLPWSQKEFENLTSRDYCHYLVAQMEDRIVGCLGMTVICGEADVDKVMVTKDCQGMGICQELFRQLFLLGDRLAVEAYTLEVRVSNEAAIHIYEKMGFVKEGIRPGFYEKPVEDALIMWKRK